MRSLFKHSPSNTSTENWQKGTTKSVYDNLKAKSEIICGKLVFPLMVNSNEYVYDTILSMSQLTHAGKGRILRDIDVGWIVLYDDVLYDDCMMDVLYIDGLDWIVWILIYNVYDTILSMSLLTHAGKDRILRDIAAMHV